MLRVGIDVGGTFTDLVGVDDAGRVSLAKSASTPADPSIGVMDGLVLLAAELGTDLAALLADTGLIVHGTTVATNALLERKGAKVGMLTTSGHRDVIEMREGLKDDRYNLRMPPPVPLVPRARRLDVTERLRFDGSVETPLSKRSAETAIRRLGAAGVGAVAVCYLHAYRDPRHERETRKLLARLLPDAYVSLSSEVLAQIKEYERFCTTVVNAYVGPVLGRYLGNLGSRLRKAGYQGDVLIMQSHGGVATIADSVRLAAGAVLSGPAGGIAASRHASRLLGEGNLISFDMGGTSTDIALLEGGEPHLTGDKAVGASKVALPSIDIHTLGAGGGSIARVEPTGALKVGPRSAGAMPGPACYGQGGAEPTVSDANLLLGYLNAERIYGGSIRLDPARAESVIGPLAARFGFSLIEAAHGVVEVANANMLRALRLVSVQRGYDLREFALIAYGGAGPLHAGALARQAGISSVIVPAHSGAFSALGCLVSPLRYDTVQTHRARLETWDAKVVEERFSALEAQCLRPLLDEGHAMDRIALLRSLDFRYVGQNYELEIGFVPGGPAALKAAFEKRHRQLYGYATGENVECVNLRMTARVAEEPAPLPAPPSGTSAAATSSHRAYFPETGAVEMLRYDRTSLPPGHLVAGPAMVEDEWSTTIVYPGMRCVADRLGNLVIEVGAPA